MNVDIVSFVKFQEAKTAKVWDVGNKVLYDLCAKYPYHNDISEVVAKLWLIGRSYAAAIERRKNAEESNDMFYIKVAKKLISSGLDQQIEKLPKINELSRENIKIISKAHSFLARLFCELTETYKGSLASKYLHFHRQIVPISDSRSRKGIADIFKNDKSQYELLQELSPEHKDALASRDKDYLKFVIKMFYLQSFLLRKTGKLYTTRDIDKYLMEEQEQG